MTYVPTVWKRVTLGVHKTNGEYYEALKAARCANDATLETVCAQELITVSRRRRVVDIACVELSDLSVPPGIRLPNLIREAKRVGLRPCPHEVALALRLATSNMGFGSGLTVATEPLYCAGNVHHFMLLHKQLNLTYGYDDCHLDERDEIAFVIPKQR